MTAALVGGESDQLRALHDRHGHALWSYTVGLTGGDRGKAQDVVQETLLRALHNLAGLKQLGGSARGWLFTVAKRGTRVGAPVRVGLRELPARGSRAGGGCVPGRPTSLTSGGEPSCQPR